MADASQAQLLAQLLQNYRPESPAPIAPGTPVMKPWEPRYVTDNVAPMVTDAATALGVPSTVANRLGKEAGTAAGYTPPGAFVDAAGDIGGSLHEGDGKGALLKAGTWNLARMLMGPAFRGVQSMIPTQGRRDAMQAASREMMPGPEAITSMPWTRNMQSPANMADMAGYQGLRTTLNTNGIANVNNRANMRSVLGIVE